jgi:hypothetical protein
MDFRIDIGRNFEALNQFLHCMKCKKCKKCKKFMVLVVHFGVTRNEFASTTVLATPFIGGGFVG